MSGWLEYMLGKPTRPASCLGPQNADWLPDIDSRVTIYILHFILKLVT
jgi:hypothetical protein